MLCLRTSNIFRENIQNRKAHCLTTMYRNQPLFHLFISIICLLLINYIDCLSQTLAQITIIILMIVNQRAKIVFNIQGYLSHAGCKSLQNRISFTFSQIQKKADHFMCAATAIMTLLNDRPKTFSAANTTQKSKVIGSKIAQEWLRVNQPFTLREKIVHNISQLKLYQTSNKMLILNLFRQDRGLSLQNLEIQQRIQAGAWDKTIDNKVKRKFFVFNPTFLFGELFYLFDDDWAQRKILMGNYGIGKSSNQLLAKILTTHIFMFRKEGKEAEKELQESILRNANLLKSIMSFSKQKLQSFKDDSNFIKQIKSKFFEIPFILYYSLPTQQKQGEPLGIVGFNQKDFKDYLSQKQIQKLTKETSFYFCQQIERICKEKQIRMSLVIDQSNFYFSILRKIQATQQKIELLQSKAKKQQRPKKKDKIQNQIEEQMQRKQNFRKSAKLYGNFLNKVASIFKTRRNITLSCSENAQYTHFPTARPQRQNFYTLYSQKFFSKQSKISTRMVEYGKNRYISYWQRDMDLVFWFELESALLNPLIQSTAKSDNKKQSNQPKTPEPLEPPQLPQKSESTQQSQQQQFWRSDKIEALNYLKYYYYYLVFYGEFKTTYFWKDAARHMHIHQVIKNIIHKISSSERISLKRIVATLAEQIKKNKMQQQQTKKVLEEYTKIVKQLRLTVNNLCKQQHDNWNQSFLKKHLSETTRYLRAMFAMELLQIVKTFQQTGENKVVINNQQINKITEKINVKGRKMTIDQLVNRSIVYLTKDKQILTLTFYKTLQEVKTQLNSQISGVSLKIFMAQLMMDEFTKLKQQLEEKRLIYFLASRNIYIQVKGGVCQKFCIKNETYLYFTSFLSLVRKERNKRARLQKEIEQRVQKQKIEKQESANKKQQISSSINSNDNITSPKPKSKKKKKETVGSVGTVETVWQNIFSLFEKQEYKGIQNLTFGASPVTLASKTESQDQKIDAINNPYFDLVLIKKNQKKENTKKFKVVGIDVTVGDTQANYSTKIKKLIEFKKYIFINNLKFFNDKTMEIWIICPQSMAKPNSQRWLEKFHKLQNQFDQKIKIQSDALILKILSFEDIDVKGQSVKAQVQISLQKQYSQFCQYMKQMSKNIKKKSQAKK